MHVIAAKAVAFKEALQPEFKAYQQQVVANAQIVAETLIARGLRIVSGGTESHVMLVDLRAKGITGKEAEAVAGQRPHDHQQERHPQRPRKAHGHQRHPHGHTGHDHARLQGRGSPRRRRNLIADVLDNPRDEANIAAVRAKVQCADRALPGLPLIAAA